MKNKQLCQDMKGLQMWIAKSEIDGKEVKGDLIYIGFNMYIQQISQSGNTLIRCIPNSERKVEENEN